MEHAAVTVPHDIPLQIIGLKQRAIERKHSVVFTLNKTTREVALAGDRAQINGAEQELRDIFSRMKLLRPAPALPTHLSRVSPPTALRAAPRGPSRFVAAKDVNAWSWEFVAADVVGSDVDAAAFPYQLVRRKRALDQEVHHQQHHHYQQYHQRSKGFDFMQNFDNRFVETMANAVDRRTGEDADVKVDANFGRKFFSLVDVEPNHEYLWEELREKNSYTAVKSSWSNVWDPDTPGIKELIADLRLRAVELRIREPKEKLYVWVTAGSNPHKVKFVRRNGAWETKESLKTPTPHTVHDVLLSNSVSLRLWVYPRRVPVGPDWHDIASAVTLRDSDSGSIFDTKVTLDEAKHTASPLSVTYIAIKSQLEIPFANLRFKLTQTGDRGDGVTLEVALPKQQPGFQSTPGGKSAMLLKRVEALLERYPSAPNEEQPSQ